MNLYRPIIAFLLLFSTTTLSAQNQSLLFKKLTLITYEVSGSGKNKKISITDQLEINNGTVHHITKIYKGIADTIYLLPDSMIARLNSVFNGKRQLKSYLKIKKLPPGHFGGQPYFLSYTDQKNIIQNFIVVDIYMNQEFYSAFNLLSYLPFAGNAKYKTNSIKNALMESKVLKYHNACTYLPDMEEPPPAIN
ncbi:MAG: hypothetical protein V4592_05130 [Bacteroidota bacterium]